MELDSVQPQPVPQSDALIDGFTVPEVTHHQASPMLPACTRGVSYQAAVEGENAEVEHHLLLYSYGIFVYYGIDGIYIHEQADCNYGRMAQSIEDVMCD